MLEMAFALFMGEIIFPFNQNKQFEYFSLIVCEIHLYPCSAMCHLWKEGISHICKICFLNSYDTL